MNAWFRALILVLISGTLGLNSVSVVYAQTVNRLESGLTQQEAYYQLLEQGFEQLETGQFQQALATYQRALKLLESLNDSPGIAEALMRIGEVYTNLGDYPQALDNLQAALKIHQDLSNWLGVGETFNHLGYVYRLWGDYDQALELHQQALTIGQNQRSVAIQGESLHQIAAVRAARGEYQYALALYQQALGFRQEVSRIRDEGRTLNNLAGVYYSLGNYEQAIEVYQQALRLRQTIKDQAGINRILSNLGLAYDQLGRYQQALEVYQQAIAGLEQIGDRTNISYTLNNLGTVYEKLGQDQDALMVYQQALTLAQAIQNPQGESNALENLGGIYYNRGQYPQALELYHKSLEIRRKLGDKSGLSKTLNNIAGVYYDLGQYSQALELLQQALNLRQEIGDRNGEGETLRNIGIVYERLENYNLALINYQHALGIAETLKNPSHESYALDQIGGIYQQFGESQQALSYYQKALAIATTIQDAKALGRTYNNIAGVYLEIGQYTAAGDTLQQALEIYRQAGDKPGESIIFSNLGTLAVKQNKLELAIVFYKAAININEIIRQNLRQLSVEQQTRYTEIIGKTYRDLADLLLNQGRILEAQQILELLKVEELRQFTRNRQIPSHSSENITSASEQEILKIHGSLIALGRQIEACKINQCDQKTQLLDQREKLTREFNENLRSLAEEIRKRRANDIAFIDPRTLNRSAENLVNVQPKTVLIYSLVQQDKLWIIWLAAGGIINSIEVPNVGVQKISETVVRFRQLLQNPRSHPTRLKATAQQLYTWLIPPSLQQEIQQNQIENLVFALDHVTRYIPMGVLFDGKNYLVENYNISTIVSSDFTNLTERLPSQVEATSVLALGLSEGIENFSPLPNVAEELDAIVRDSPQDLRGIYPGQEFLNAAFNYQSLRDNLANHLILHIATHGEFKAGNAYDSFLLLGNGEKLPIPDIQTLQDLSHIHLVVLSACKTALGGAGTDGTEIAGLSYYFLNGGAKAAIASLWQVDDASTRLLMERFYSYLAQPSMTKSRALRQAQLSLLQDEEFLSHPFYWAAFILSGNPL